MTVEGQPITFQHFTRKLSAADDPKRNAAAEFAVRLLRSPVGSSIARIILFGSVARNDTHPNSDVDILVFGAVDRKTLSEHAAQAAWEAGVIWGELVAQLSYGISDLFQPRSFFLLNTVKTGKEIYAMDQSEVRRMEAEGLLRKARRHLEQAQEAVIHGGDELAIVGAYTACELAARALVLLVPGIELPSSHGGMLQIFSREYVKTDKVPEYWGRMFSQGLEARSHALYDTQWTVDERDAKQIIRLAMEMLNFLEQELASSQS